MQNLAPPHLINLATQSVAKVRLIALAGEVVRIHLAREARRVDVARAVPEAGIGKARVGLVREEVRLAGTLKGTD